MFAGPNGAGKTSAYEWLRLDRPDIPWGVYVNADLIEQRLESRGFLDLAEWGLQGDQSSLHEFAARSGWSDRIPDEALLLTANVIRVSHTVPSTYIAAVLADWLRELLIEQRVSLTTETVMSHPAKLELLRKAHALGYRTYLYFVATEDPEIQIERISRRTEKGGHAVPGDKVIERYSRSLALLPQAIQLADRAYIFDNTSTLRLFAEYEHGQLKCALADAPAWFVAE